MKAVSLFSGIGAFELAGSRAGMDFVASAEIDTKRQAVLNRHFPHIKQLGAVQNVTQKAIGETTIDVVFGGSPCQDFSVAGLRQGISGERSGLVYEYFRVLDEVRPTWLVWENVPGVLSSNGGRDFAAILSEMVKRGFYLAYRVLDAQYYGVPQRRRRIFVVGHRGDGRASKVLFDSASVQGNLKSRPEAWENLTRNAEARTNETGTPFGFHPKASASQSLNPSLISPTLDKSKEVGIFTRQWGGYSFRQSGISSALQASDYKRPDMRLVIDLQQITSKQNRSVPRKISPTLTKNSDLVAFNPRHYLHGVGSGNTGNISQTLISHKSGGGYSSYPHIASTGVRRLTPLECERLQGFPDNWTADQSDKQRYEQLGDSIAVPVAEWICKRIMENAGNNPKSNGNGLPIA